MITLLRIVIVFCLMLLPCWTFAEDDIFVIRDAKKVEAENRRWEEAEKRVKELEQKRKDKERQLEDGGYCFDNSLNGAIQLAVIQNGLFIQSLLDVPGMKAEGTGSPMEEGTNRMSRVKICQDLSMPLDCSSYSGEYTIGLIDRISGNRIGGSLGLNKVIANHNRPDREFIDRGEADLYYDGIPILQTANIRVRNRIFIGFSTIVDDTQIDYTGNDKQGVAKLSIGEYSFTFSFGNNYLRLIDTKGPVQTDVSQRLQTKNNAYDIRQNNLIKLMGQFISHNCRGGSPILSFVQNYTRNTDYRDQVIDYVVRNITLQQ